MSHSAPGLVVSLHKPSPTSGWLTPPMGRRRPCRVSPTHPATSQDWQTAGKTPHLPCRILTQTCTGKGTPRPQGKGMAPEGGSGFRHRRGAPPPHPPAPCPRPSCCHRADAFTIGPNRGRSDTRVFSDTLETAGPSLAGCTQTQGQTPTPTGTHLASGVTAPSAPSRSVPSGRGTATSLPSEQEGG